MNCPLCGLWLITEAYIHYTDEDLNDLNVSNSLVMAAHLFYEHSMAYCPCGQQYGYGMSSITMLAGHLISLSEPFGDHLRFFHIGNGDV